jgi:ethanolamine ammonia-lyase large subunit
MSRRARQRFDRRVLLNPVAVAIEGAALLPASDRIALQHIVANALAVFRTGKHCSEMWCVMADALNMAEGLARIGIASDAASAERITAAQRVLADVHLRHTTRGTWTLHAAELQALDDGLWVHRVQLDHCSLREYERAKSDTVERMRQARAGNAPRGAIVIEGAIA